MAKSSTPKELYLVIAVTLSETLSDPSSIFSRVISKENSSPKVKKEKKRKKTHKQQKNNPSKIHWNERKREEVGEKLRWWKGKVRHETGDYEFQLARETSGKCGITAWTRF